MIGKKSFLFFLICILFLNCACSKVKQKKSIIYNIRSNEMTLELPYDLVPADGNIYRMYSMSKPDCWIQVSANGTFGVGSLSENYNITYKPFDPQFPPVPCDETGTDYRSTIVWGTRGKGFYAYDYQTGKSIHTSFLQDINSEILEVQLLNSEKKYVIVTLSHSKIDISNTRIFSHHIVNISDDTVIFNSEEQEPLVYPFSNDNVLLSDNNGWKKSDVMLRQLPPNDLTKKLTHSKVWIYNNKSISNGFAIGTSNVALDTIIPVTIEWNNDFSEASIKPIIAQIPKKQILRIPFIFSPDGKWLVGWCTDDYVTGEDKIVFFHVDKNYPQHLSLPLLGGKSKKETNGCFVNHSKLGPLYIQNEPDGSAIRVYHLNKIPGILSDAALKGM